MNHIQTQEVSYIDIDVSKKTLEVLEPANPKSYSITNTKRSLDELLQKVSHLQNLHVICEATGGDERTLVDFMHKNRIAVSIVSPTRVRHFARSEGVKAKTGPIDTKMLMRFAQEKHPRPTDAPSPERRQLADLMDRREQLNEQLKREKTRLQKCNGFIAESTERMIALVQAEVNLREGKIKDLVASEPTFTTLYWQNPSRSHRHNAP